MLFMLGFPHDWLFRPLTGSCGVMTKDMSPVLILESEPMLANDPKLPIRWKEETEFPPCIGPFPPPFALICCWSLFCCLLSWRNISNGSAVRRRCDCCCIEASGIDVADPLCWRFIPTATSLFDLETLFTCPLPCSIVNCGFPKMRLLCWFVIESIAIIDQYLLLEWSEGGSVTADSCFGVVSFGDNEFFRRTLTGFHERPICERIQSSWWVKFIRCCNKFSELCVVLRSSAV